MHLLQTIISQNPATLEKLGEVPITSADQIAGAVAEARHALALWSSLSYQRRAHYLLAAADFLQAHRDDIIDLITNENGKPKIEAFATEILPVLDMIHYFAKNTEALLRPEKIRLGKWNILGRSSYLEFKPLGVIGIISPWNYPFSIPAGLVAMALMAGNTVLLKPSEYTPLIGCKIGEMFANLPQGVLKIIPGNGTTGANLVTSGVNKIMFTGSVATGKKIMAAAAENLTPITLELGGKDPMIVCADADLGRAAKAAVWGAFTNAGQVCASVERLYVHEDIAQSFTDLLVEETKKLRQGEGHGEVDVGPMTVEIQLKKVTSHVEDAIKRGATVLVGGKKNPNLPGYFFEPTILTNIDHTFDTVREETFGPTLPVMTFRSEEEAVRLANDSPYALNAYVWTHDFKRGKKLASQIEAGTVNINESIFTFAIPQAPWGGPKASGLGRTHGKMGLLEMVEVKHIHVNWAYKMPNFWWYGYTRAKLKTLQAFGDLLFAKGSVKRIKALYNFIRYFRKI